MAVANVKYHHQQMFAVCFRVLYSVTRIWANAQRDGRPAEHRWRPLLNAAKFG